MKKVFITGGSGTVGSSFIKKNYNQYKFYSYSRNEKSQVELKRKFPAVEIILGSIENRTFLIDKILECQPDIIIHAAALKHVDLAEKQPMRTVETNIFGSMNVIEAAKICNVPVTIGISTDKASKPDNVYGYTKLLMEKMFVEANNDKNKFACCRFGNVAGSQGSVIPFWLSLKNNKKPLRLTHPDMTRLMFSSEEAADLIYKSIIDCQQTGGFILSKKMKKVNMHNLARCISDEIDIVGLRPGEKISESLICKSEIKYTFVEGEYIFINKEKNTKKENRLANELSSATAVEMTQEQMCELIRTCKVG